MKNKPATKDSPKSAWIGIFFVALGIVWLLEDLGLISFKLSLWPFVFIALGIWITKENLQL